MGKILRYLAGGCLLAKGLHSLVEDSIPLIGALFGIVLTFAGVGLLLPGLAAWAASPLTGFIDGIYMAGGHSAEPPALNYRLAEHYFKQRRWDLAVAEYEKILEYYPGELRAYAPLLDILANEQEEPEEAERLYRRGLGKLPDDALRQRLEEIYNAGEVAKFQLPEQEPLAQISAIPPDDRRNAVSPPVKN